MNVLVIDIGGTHVKVLATLLFVAVFAAVPAATAGEAQRSGG